MKAILVPTYPTQQKYCRLSAVFLQLNLERQSKAGFQKINEWKSITVNMGHKKGFAVSDGAA